MPPLILNSGANDLRRLLSPRYSPSINIAWNDLSVTLANGIDAFVDQPRRLLQQIRDFTTTDEDFVILIVNMLGLNYNSTLISVHDNPDSSPSGDAFRRLAQGLTQLWSEKGTAYFVDFIGYVLNVQFELITLWTNDYVTFVQPYQVPDDLNTLNFTEYVQGHYYPTAHVGLQYDGFQFDSYTNSDINPQDVSILFYKIAPIHLVLAWVGSTFSTEVADVYISESIFDFAELTSSNVEAEEDLYLAPFTVDKAIFTTQNIETNNDLYMGGTVMDMAVFTTSNINTIPTLYLSMVGFDWAEFTTISQDCPFDPVDCNLDALE